MIKVQELFEAYNKMDDRFSDLMKKVFSNEPVDNKKRLKTKTNSYDRKRHTNVHDNGMPKDYSHYV